MHSESTTDDFGRTTEKKSYISLSKGEFVTEYGYDGANDENDKYTSNTVKTLTQKFDENSLVNYEYSYDKNGNITEIKQDGNVTNTYKYDSLNQLTEEYNYLDKFYINYSYDQNGNIHSMNRQYLNSDNQPSGKPTGNVYYYDDTEWCDKLTKLNSYNITYDAVGNPLNYRDGISFTWKNGRWLSSTTLNDGTKVTYQYNLNGMRTQKTVGNKTTNYYYDSNNNLIGLVSYKNNKIDNVLFFYYDSDNSPISLKYNNTMYYYVKNIQGDIVKIIDENGTEVAGYVYDAWGNTLTTTGDTTLGSLNPLRYRGYVYDTDTGLYYLQSRYYDPFTGRFLNADDTYVLQLSDSEILSTNLYTYCGNNPINNTDPEGNWGLPTPAKLIAAALIGGLIGAACEAIIQIMLEHKSLKTLKWGSIAIEFVSGALTGVLIACNFPASLTNLGRGVINMLTSLAHSIKKGSFKSISGAFKAIGSAILSGIITIVIGSIRTTRGKTLNYTTVKNMIKKIGLNRVARGGFRFGIGWFTIKFA